MSTFKRANKKTVEGSAEGRRERAGREGKGMDEGGTALEVYIEENSVQPCHS
jgi:hypothetical protein